VTVICCYWATGCSYFVHKASYPEPPPTTYRVGYFTVTATGGPERVQVAVVMPDFFKAVNARPLIGRLFIAEDYQGKAQTILVSHKFWQRRFGGNPNIIGTTVDVDGKSMTIIGVMPNDFDLPRGTEFWRAQELAAP